MIEEVEIQIWSHIAGYAAYKQSKLVYFEYDSGFPAIYDLAPISMARSAINKSWSFDLEMATYHGLPGLLADSLPDKYGTKMMDAWFIEQGIPLGELTVLDKLCYLGTRAMGALEYHPLQGPRLEERDIDIKALVELSNQVLSNRLEFTSSLDEGSDLLSDLLKIGSSAGGARAKAVIGLNPETLEISSGQIQRTGFEPWIIKLDGITNDMLGDPLAYTNIEYAYHLMAVDCGIQMMPSKLFEENCRYHFLTKRFDREADGSKVHMQTLCALAHLDYNYPHSASYEIVFRIANQLKLSMAEKEQIFKRMVFNVVGKNLDDHSKNISFLMNQEGRWRLAPAYDLTFAYNPNNRWLKEHNMLINNKSQNITRDDILSLAEKFHIKSAERYIEEILAVFAEFSSYASQAKVPEDKISYIKQHLLTELGS